MGTMSQVIADGLHEVNSDLTKEKEVPVDKPLDNNE